MRSLLCFFLPSFRIASLPHICPLFRVARLSTKSRARNIECSAESEILNLERRITWHIFHIDIRLRDSYRSKRLRSIGYAKAGRLACYSIQMYSSPNLFRLIAAPEHFSRATTASIPKQSNLYGQLYCRFEPKSMHRETLQINYPAQFVFAVNANHRIRWN